MRTADLFNIAPFEASLIIAMVQDAVRRGESGLGPAIAERLEALPAPAPRRDRLGPALSVASSALIAVAMVALTVRWLLGG